jgi:ParB family chromosome partitioning protein
MRPDKGRDNQQMNEDVNRKRLGRGLAALIGELDLPEPETRAEPIHDGWLPVSAILPNPANPRTHFAEDEIAELAESIREHGLVQPVVVRPSQHAGNYEIIAGERRWRAAMHAGLQQIPAIVREVDDRTALEIAIVENVQRSDLNALEEARGYRSLMEGYGYTQQDLSKVIGKSRSHVANILRLLRLPETVQQMLTEGLLSAGHARALVTAENPEALARKIVTGGLSVRQAEALAQQADEPQQASKPEKDADTRALERLLSDQIGMTATISHRAKGGGEVRIAYKSLEQLDELCRRLRS